MQFEPLRDIDRLANRLFGSTYHGPFIPMDVYRSGNYYTVELDLPGVDPDSIDVSVERGSLTVAAERTAHYSENERVLVAERPVGSFTRRLMLGEGMDLDKLDATYEDGVLTIRIPVSPSVQPRHVEIGRGNGQQRRITEQSSSAQPASEGKSGARNATNSRRGAGRSSGSQRFEESEGDLGPSPSADPEAARERGDDRRERDRAHDDPGPNPDNPNAPPRVV